MEQINFGFDNSYARLPERFYARLEPTAVKAPGPVIVNDALALSLGLEPQALGTPEAAEIFAGNCLPPGAEPLAMAYAGHQFGHFVPQLGDGRAILLGEIIDKDGIRQDIHLKGAGRTPYSRGGDGRAALGPVLREFILSAHMKALGIPTTLALAAVTTGEAVYREDLKPGAVLTRVAKSHLRIGTFEYFAAREDLEALKLLIDFAIDRHDPDLKAEPLPALGLLRRVMERQAALVAKWISVGFIHGVMNTDNTSISGQTIDYGPCAFLDTYHPDKVFSSIDQGGRYAFMNQPGILQWNLGQLAYCLLPFIDEDLKTAVAMAQEVVDALPETFSNNLRRAFAAKLGLRDGADDALGLGLELLELMAAGEADFTNTFRSLPQAIAETSGVSPFAQQFADPKTVSEWVARWRIRITEDNETIDQAEDRLKAANPAVIARNHRVEEVIRAAEDHADYAPLYDLLAVLEKPFDDQRQGAKYALAPNPEEEVKQTFCGT
ncbi:MAG: protein adenylyltransferase SelO [Magnetovibrionaceae bacterium]